MTGVEEKRTEKVIFRLAPCELAYVLQEARDAGMTLSEWLRGCVLPEDGE